MYLRATIRFHVGVFQCPCAKSLKKAALLSGGIGEDGNVLAAPYGEAITVAIWCSDGFNWTVRNVTHWCSLMRNSETIVEIKIGSTIGGWLSRRW